MQVAQDLLFIVFFLIFCFLALRYILVSPPSVSARDSSRDSNTGHRTILEAG